ncbi:MAG: ATP-binding protein [Devosia sp.]|nr:ATP-binding protein [Devosia sp.]
MLNPASYTKLRRCAGVFVGAMRSVERAAFDEDVWIVGAVLAVLCFLYAVMITIDTRGQAVLQARSDMRGMGIALAEQTSRYVQTVDLLVEQAQSHLQDLGIRAPDAFRRLAGGEDIRRFLAAQAVGLPAGHGIDLFDADGTLLNSSQPSQTPFNIADHAWFRQLRDFRYGGAVIGEVAARYRTGEKAFFIGRRISGPDGVFLGAAVAAVDIVGVYKFYTVVDHQWRLSVTLRRNDGLVLMHYPTTGGINYVVPATAAWFELLMAGGGIYRAPDDPAAAGTIISINPTPRYPLALDIAIPEQIMLKPWHEQAIYLMTAGGAFSLVLLAIFILIGRQIRQRKEQTATLSRAMATLRQNEARLIDFTTLASDWFWEQDADLRFVGPAVGVVLRARDKEPPVRKRRWELNDTSKNPEGWENHKRALLAHEPFRDFRFEQIDENGDLRHVSVSGVPVYDGTGKFTGYHGIGRDITAQIEAEHELRQAKDKAERAEALLQEAIDSVAEGFLICDSSGRHMMCNEGYRRFYHYLTGESWAPGITSEEVLNLVLATGKYLDTIGRDQAWLDEWRRQNLEVPSSTERPLADGRWLLVTKRRMRNGGNAMLMTDITALKQALSALRDSEARLERAQEMANIGSWEVDVVTGEAIWSRQLYRMRGFPPDFRPNLANLHTRLHPDDVQPLLTWHADLAAGRQRDPIEIRVRLPNGEERVNLNDGRPMAGPDSVIRHVVGTAQDITERRLIESKLAQSQKMDALGQLTGGMAHDFNNMLGIIIGNLDLLTPLLAANALAGELCAEARDGAVRCADLIRRLLAFARRQSLRPEQTDINALARDLSHLLSRTLGENITLTLDLADALWPVKVDPVRLEAALVNLATNARDAMPKSGQLTIATRNITLDTIYMAQHPDANVGDYTLIEISDTGIGIAPEIVNRIFDPFFTTKASGGGTGLGLSMAFGFVRQSGGHLSVYSEPGLGTTFRIYLPRNDSEEAVAAPAPSAGRVVGGHETILLVEDNAPLRRTAGRQLSELGYKVHEADSALPALAILSDSEPVDLLFTDIVMPGTMDGLDLAYKATRVRQDLKVLLASGFPGGHDADRRVAESPFRLLGKPYSLGDLAQAIRITLDHGR